MLGIQNPITFNANTDKTGNSCFEVVGILKLEVRVSSFQKKNYFPTFIGSCERIVLFFYVKVYFEDARAWYHLLVFGISKICPVEPENNSERMCSIYPRNVGDRYIRRIDGIEFLWYTLRLLEIIGIF